jgi:hypothetical protein
MNMKQNELTAERIEEALHYLVPIYDSAHLDGYKRNLGTALAALRAEKERDKGCDFCHRGKPIKAHTYLPDCGLQYGVSVQADFCPVCGRRLTEEGENK